MSASHTPMALWDDALLRIINLSKATIKKNEELEQHVRDLELECAFWKKSHAFVVNQAEREVQSHRLAMASAYKEIQVETDVFRDQDPFIFCVINGDKTLFSQALLSQGQSGGVAAAELLTKSIADRLAAEEVQVLGRFSYFVYLYCNKTAVCEQLSNSGVCTREQFEAFIVGFSQASPRFSFVDVGPGRSDIADVKIIEFLKTFSALPQTVKIFLSGGDDPIYTKLFLSLEEQSLLGKLVMLRESNAPHQFAFPVPQLVADGLFMISSRASTPPRPTLAVHSSVISNGGLISPQSPPMSIPRPIDPSLPLHKQAPPPCNEFYLMSCSKGPGQCKYSHEYKLTQDQLASLAQNAKKAPCNFLKNNMHCPHGDSCCWGHVCPNGPGCYHKSKGKCWFKNMHSA